MKFIRSVIDEMKQVTWPSKKQLRKDVRVVIETSILFAIYLGVIDFVITKIFSSAFKIHTRD